VRSSTHLRIHQENIRFPTSIGCIYCTRSIGIIISAKCKTA
jgi:hypothetical protein